MRFRSLIPGLAALALALASCDRPDLLTTFIGTYSDGFYAYDFDQRAGTFVQEPVAKAEMPNKKSFVWTRLFWFGTSYIVGTMVYLIGTWWWTLFPILAAWGVAITLIVLNNKGIIHLGKKSKASKKSNIPIGCAGCPSAGHCQQLAADNTDGAVAVEPDKADNANDTDKHNSCCD